MADPGAYTKEELAALHSQIVSNLEQAWELTGGSEDQLSGMMIQMSQVVAREFKKTLARIKSTHWTIGKRVRVKETGVVNPGFRAAV